MSIMREVILERIDNEIAISKKEHNLKIAPPVIIGRGATFKCGEKKISRNHGTLDWDDDGILITSTHINPLFKKVNGKKHKIVKGQSSTLLDGDEFGLLEDTFWYKVVIREHAPMNGVKPVKEKSEVDCPVKAEESPLETETGTHAKKDENSVEEIIEKQALNSLNKSIEEEETHNEERVFNSKSANTRIESEDLLTSKVSEEKSSDLMSDKNCLSTVAENKKVVSDTKKSEDCNPVIEAASYSGHRNRSLPKWMLKCAPDGTSPSKSKPNESTVQNPQSSLKKSPTQTESPRKQGVQHGRKRKANKPRTPKKLNQYHAVSQDFDDIKDLESKGNSKLHTLSSEEEEEESTSAKTVQKGVPVSQSTRNQINLTNPLKRKKIDKDSPTKRKQHGPNDESSSKSNAHHTLSSDEERESLPGVASKMTKPTSSEKNTPKKTEGDETSQKGSSPRKSCYFGEQCYRKNPLHRTTMAHPGDDDYTSPNEEVDADDSDDDRPQCEFGVECYRKNPQHKKEFKHTRNPQPQRRVKRKAKLKQKQDKGAGDSEDDYDFDDPFLNDDSSDDYAPTDSSDSDYDMKDAAEEGDTKRMIKEAKKFVKRR